MDDAMIQAYARLQVHEAILEVIMVNWMVMVPEHARDAFLNDFAKGLKVTWARDGKPDPSTDQIVSDAIDIGAMFLGKVRTRAQEIYPHLSREDSR